MQVVGGVESREEQYIQNTKTIGIGVLEENVVREE
jgi:hypothetical protein